MYQSIYTGRIYEDTTTRRPHDAQNERKTNKVQAGGPEAGGQEPGGRQGPGPALTLSSHGRPGAGTGPSVSAPRDEAPDPRRATGTTPRKAGAAGGPAPGDNAPGQHPYPLPSLALPWTPGDLPRGPPSGGLGARQRAAGGGSINILRAQKAVPDHKHPCLFL